MDHLDTGKMNRSRRFVISASAVNGSLAYVSGAELHHMRHVMRLRPGAIIRLLTEDGNEFNGRLLAYQCTLAQVEICPQQPQIGKPKLILAAALIRGSRMDFMVEKAAELGADELWPLLCERGTAREPGAQRCERWHRIALAAAKQSLSPHAMTISQPIDVSAMLRRIPPEAVALLCTPGARSAAALIRQSQPQAVVVACGPEGGFEQSEEDAMRAAGFIPASLGPTRLRSETAALAALSQIAGALEELDRRI
jgi:16S rRNA (uracil1498-N3)-methyltransferase